MPGVIATVPKYQFSDSLGTPLAGGTLTTYIAGTTTLTNTWQDEALTTANTNPIVLDSRGECVLWLSSSVTYKLVLKNAVGVTQWTVDNVSGSDNGLQLVTALSATLAASGGAALIGYTQGGAGTVATTVQSKLRETVSVKDFGAKGDGTTDDATSFVAALTYLRGLTSGGTLYIPPGVYAVSTVAFQWATGGSNITLNIQGAGQRATILKKLGATTSAVLDLTVSALNNGVYSAFSDFGVQGNGSCPGIKVTQFARWQTRNLFITSCTQGMESLGTLICDHYNLIAQANQIGYRCRSNGGIYPNLVTFNGGAFFQNTQSGADIGEAENARFNSVDIELNGTSADTTTGGLILRSTCGTVGQRSQIAINGCWFEGNLGNSLLVESATYLALAVRDTPFILNPATRAIICGAIRSLIVDNCSNDTSGDKYDIGATQNTIICGGSANTIVNASLNWTYEGVQIGGVSYAYLSGGASKPTFTRNGGLHQSGQGNVSSTTAVAATLLAASGATPRMYQVFACLGGAGSNYTANARFAWDAANLVRMGGDNATNMTLTASGVNIQATQTSGSAQTIFYVIDIIG